jgi:FtsP/CotA-like multicopper oxidase with cupredoxin domain
MTISRRALMLGVGAAALQPVFPIRRSFADTDIRTTRLTAKPAIVNLTGDGHPDTAVWSYEGSMPGPAIRVPQGAPVRLVVGNNLAEDTTVHWHGIRLPNAMDGVPYLTQPPIRAANCQCDARPDRRAWFPGTPAHRRCL